MKLYIANGTRQLYTFMYRLPEVTQPRTQTIGVGRQILISGDLNPIQIEAIVKQYRKYGMIPAAEIETTRGLAPLAWQTDRPITAEKITRLMARNEGVQIERGRQFRKDAAVVMTANLGSNLRETGLPGELAEVEVGMIEERNVRSNADGAPLEETIVVSPEKPGARPSKASRRRMPRAA